MFWTIRSFPRCTHHVFLSHSGEDQPDLVLPVYRRLKKLDIEPWIDRHDYPYGSDSRSSLRNGILSCRHVVIFLTPNLLKNARGWCAIEMAYSEIVQGNLVHPGGELLHVLLPLFFVSRDDPGLHRSAWRTLLDRGPFFQNEKSLNRIDWAADRIAEFLTSEERLAGHFRSLTRTDKRFRELIDTGNGLKNRVTRFEPNSIYQKPTES
ncbi:MAG: toll/interleukin-1 receptor domain-containing protein [Gemmataceae bacterium]|nr:toll/interleukin-1 receptor domain-containing protein [Gemmataceae bacterium]